MIKFKYCGTHIEDEKYMNKMRVILFKHQIRFIY